MSVDNTNQSKARETVVLIHGLWMRGGVMGYLARQLRRHGFAVKVFSYHSVLNTAAENADRLHTMLEDIDTPIVHLVGHSLGGIVLMHLLKRQLHLKPGRVVLLGAPIHGSHVAENICKIPILRTIVLGRSIHHALLGGAPSFSGQRELGVICGDKGFGIGRLLSRTHSAGDGTVLLSETAIEKSRDSVELPVTHTSMLFSKEVAENIACFLENGTFAKERNHGRT